MADIPSVQRGVHGNPLIGTNPRLRPHVEPEDAGVLVHRIRDGRLVVARRNVAEPNHTARRQSGGPPKRGAKDGMLGTITFARLGGFLRRAEPDVEVFFRDVFAHKPFDPVSGAHGIPFVPHRLAGQLLDFR